MLRMRQDRSLSRRAQVLIWAGFGTVVIAALVILTISFQQAPPPGVRATIEGAAITGSDNPHRQAPIPNVDITATASGYSTSAKSQISGFFRLPLASEWKAGQSVTLTFRADNFQPLQQTVVPGTDLIIARLIPLEPGQQPNKQTGTATSITNVRVRYSTEFITTTNVGSIAPTLDIPNVGNTLCGAGATCSPDGKWKAAIGMKTLDAGEDNEYINTRVSCIAGPCPFTQIMDNRYAKPARVIRFNIKNWSDTTTFLIEAEVSRTQRSNFVREAYPAIFGQAMTFTLPPGAQGLSILADLNGHPIVFPIGPALRLSWAVCNVETSPDGSKLFRCELKPGYRFVPQPSSS